MKRLVCADLHISNKSSNRQAQRRYLDLTEQQRPDELFFIGDTLDRAGGAEAALDDELTVRLVDIAARIHVVLIAGNFPHDDWQWLTSVADRLGPIEICPVVWEQAPRQLFIHGAQWDPTISFWNHFRCVARALPCLIGTFLFQTPSTLANQGDYDALVKLSGPIHQRAQRYAIDHNIRTIFMGHTHLRQRLTAAPVHSNTVEVLGSMGSGPYTYMEWEDGRYRVLTL
jgi:UDP-2,3-diacylglucosamine pyrophosphatase LpxH